MGNTLPIGCRIVFGLSVSTYVFYCLDTSDFYKSYIDCNARQVFYKLQLQGLLLASVTFESWPALAIAITLSWRRFSFLEYQVGTSGFLVWFVWNTVVFHTLFIVMMLALSIFDDWVMNEEVHGLWPLLIIHFVSTVRDSSNGTVWLWPLPYHVPERSFPLILIVIAWVAHSYIHLDVMVAYFLACFSPSWLLEPSISFLDQVEQAPVFSQLLKSLQSCDAFVCRPPSASYRLSAFGDDCNVGAVRQGYHDIDDAFLDI